jgi:hypothetical protein
MEQTTRSGKSKPINIEALAAALEASATGVHLVGASDSMADICLLVTLSKQQQQATAMDALVVDNNSWPVIVQTYHKAHTVALEHAKQAVILGYLPTPTVNLWNDPSLMKVLTSISMMAFEQVVPDAEVPVMRLTAIRRLLLLLNLNLNLNHHPPTTPSTP